MKIGSALLIILGSSLLIFTLEAKPLDPYKVLGVEQNASQRDIQKAFHKRSLQYHPDKNKNKGAEEKFSEINNAYEILSDEKRRKNYDLYGDDKGQPGFDASNAGDQGGYTYFTSGGPGHSGHTFRSDEWPNMGGSGGSQSFSFSFGQKSSGFGLDDIFSNLFGGGMGGGGQSGGYSSSSRSEFGSRGAPKSIHAVNSQVYKKEIVDKGMTWLLLSSMPALKGTQHFESFIKEVANSLEGALKVGSINCEAESSLCKELGIHPRREPRIFVYSYATSNSGSLVEFTGDLSVKILKTFIQEHLPRFSKRTDVSQFEFSSGSERNLPKVMLLSTKKDTPVIWRVLSGLYHKRVAFYDAQVHDFSDPTVRRLGVDALPAVIGWLSNGENHILKTGISVKDMKSGVEDLSALLDSFEKKNKRSPSSQAKKPSVKQIPILSASNFDSLCGDSTPVCIIGAFRSSRSKGKLEKILSEVSHKPLSRGRSLASGSGDSVSYVLLDASKHSSFLYSLDKSGFKSADNVLIAYKPRKGKHAAFVGEVTSEEVEKFVGSVLNGDVKFTKTPKKPTIK